ncbi:hypothetical protein [Gordonia paraffinivorans]|uniref:hypothetical protein n=1 Tax=Gordonia paraffinivorans TaxID=175628 RepID=UPI001445DACB
MWPRSNISLRLYRSWDAHPLPRLCPPGVPVSLNTDDPAILGTALEADWSVPSSIWGLDEDNLKSGLRRRRRLTDLAPASKVPASRPSLLPTASGSLAPNSPRVAAVAVFPQ